MNTYKITYTRVLSTHFHKSPLILKFYHIIILSYACVMQKTEIIFQSIIEILVIKDIFSTYKSFL